MRRININNRSELALFKSEVSDYLWVNDHIIIPYRRDDSTNRGANYTMFVPLHWKNALTPKKLHSALRNEVDADAIVIEYIDFVRE